MNYKQLLRNPKWQKKRLQIFQRDNWSCRYCGSSEKNLQVHHKTYIFGRNPWDYDNDFLETLCCDCHETEEFIRKNKLGFTYLLTIGFTQSDIRDIQLMIRDKLDGLVGPDRIIYMDAITKLLSDGQEVY